MEALGNAPEAENTVDAVAEGFLAKHSVRDARGRVVRKGGRPVITRRGEKLEALLRRHALGVNLPGRGRFGALSVAAVEAADLRALVERAREKRVIRKRDLGGPRPAQSLLALLKLVLGYAVKMGQTRSNVFADWKPEDFSLPKAKSRKRALSADEVGTLLTHPAIDLPGLLAGAPYPGKLPPQVRAAVPLLLLTGLRTSGLDATPSTSKPRSSRLRRRCTRGLAS